VSEEIPRPSIQHVPSIAQCRYFRIELRGQVGEVWLAAFDPVSLSISDQVTWLEVRVDQAALRGILNRLWDLNLNILSVVEIAEPAVQNGEKGNE
jgi:hypothetical protein